MSYILEALRKSERQRRANEEAPVARLAAEPARPATRRRSVVIALSILANLALLLYLALGINLREDPGSAAKPGERSSTAATEPAPTQQAASAETSKRSAPVAPPAGSDANARPPAKLKAATPGLPTKAATLPRAKREQVRTPPPAAVGSDSESALANALPQRPSTASLGSERSGNMGSRRRPAMEVDQSATETDFPKPKINVYAYSNRNDADRFVIISNRKYREGDRIEDGGGTVKRIEEHAMTLEYEGQTYKVPRP